MEVQIFILKAYIRKNIVQISISLLHKYETRCGTFYINLYSYTMDILDQYIQQKRN
jgi:hypothetical protein